MKAKDAVVLTDAFWSKMNDYPVVHEELEKIYPQIKANANLGMNWIRLSCDNLPNFYFYEQYENFMKEQGDSDHWERMKERALIFDQILICLGYKLEHGNTPGIVLGKNVIVRWGDRK